MFMCNAILTLFIEAKTEGRRGEGKKESKVVMTEISFIIWSQSYKLYANKCMKKVMKRLSQNIMDIRILDFLYVLLLYELLKTCQ